VELPPDALARLRAVKMKLIGVGNVVWLPARHVAFFPGGKDRFCLVAGIEPTSGGTPGRIHLIGGSTQPSIGPKVIRVAAGEGGLPDETYFKFWWSDSVTVAVLMSDGKWKGRLNPNRLSEIENAVSASTLVNLKRLWLP
jgi:hypothetical protein